MYDSLILCCTGNIPNSHQKSLMNAFLCTPIIVPRPFMKIIEEISPKANPFTTAQEYFCFHLQRGNPCFALVTETHLSMSPALTTVCCFHGPTGDTQIDSDSLKNDVVYGPDNFFPWIYICWSSTSGHHAKEAEFPGEKLWWKGLYVSAFRTSTVSASLSELV